MNRQILSLFAIVVLAYSGIASAQESSTNQPEPSPTTESPTSSTANPGLPYGSVCNGFLMRCNRYSETVACLQRRPEPSTTTEAAVTSEDPLMSVFLAKKTAEICETGLGVDLGKCQCQRNCKNGIYVDDGEFDEERERCVGLVGSTCTLLVPQCTKNAHCNYAASACVCDTGFADDGNRRCVAA